MRHNNLNKEGTKYIFSRDVRFTAPSLAASIVRSGTANGLTRWKDEKGNALKDYFAKQETQRSPTSSTLPQADTIDVSMTYKGCTVKGSFDLKTKETIIFKGSEATIKNAPSFKTGSRKKNKMIEAGDLSLNEAGTKLIFQRDVVFRAPSTAASIIKGMNTNGYTSWVDNQGRVIDHYFQNE